MFGLCLAAWLTTVAPSSRAEPERSAETIVGEYLAERGVQVRGPATRVFLQQGEARVLARDVQPGCTGFLALGTGHVRDVDLSLYTQGGLLLDEDVLAAPYAYVRSCAREPQTWFLSTSLYAGRGELLIFRLADAPQSVGLLPFDLGLAAPSGGRPERPRSVGPALPGPTDEERVQADEARWRARGYAPGSGLHTTPMASGMGRVSVPLEQGLCYAVSVSSAPSRHTAVVIADSSGHRWASAERASAVTAHVCPHQSGEHVVFVRAQPGGALALMRAYVQLQAGRWQPPLEGRDRARVLVGELTYRFEQRGLRVEVLGEGWIDSVGPLHWPVSMRAGHCYGLGVVALTEAPHGSLEVALETPEGELAARHRAREGSPFVFHCAERDGPHRLVIKAGGEVGRVAIVAGERAIGKAGGPRAAGEVADGGVGAH